MRERMKKLFAGMLVILAALLIMPQETGSLTLAVQAASGAQTAKTATASKAKLAKKSVTLEIGKKHTIAFQTKQKGAAYTWKTSDKSVAQVSSKGVVTAKKKGNAVITCTVKPSKGKSYQLKLKVTVKETKAVFAKKSVTLEKGKKHTVAFKTKQKGAAYKWKTSDKSVAQVSSKGVVTAKKKGNAVITCTVKPKSGKSYQLNLKVKVKDTKGDAERQAEEEKKKHLIDINKTRLIDLGFVQYVAVTYAEDYNMNNTRMIVDGVDVSEAVTAVSDDGTVAKWEITSVNPAKLTIESRTDAAYSQTVKLSDNENPMPPAVKAGTSPDYVLGYGSLAYWDYYLTNYDDQGNVRVHASKTTFARKEEAKQQEHPYYSQDAEIDEASNGNVVIMFNYNTEEEKAWFDAIPETGALELVSFDQYRNVINGNLLYEKSVAPHGNGTVGEFTIPAGQSNFTNAGRYYVRIRPESGKAVLSSIQLVHAAAPEMMLSESRAIEPGQNIHFSVKNMVYGISDPIERAELTGPDGSVQPLTFIDDYFLFGDLFVLYNDTERNDGKGINHTAQAGNYTLTVYAEGFKPMSNTFQLVDNKKAAEPETIDSVDVEVKTVDAVSSASVNSGSDSSSGTASSGGSVSANLIFNVDLYANAEIFDKLELGNAYATAIVDRYETEVTGFTAVYTKDGENFYDFQDYFNAVQNAKIAGKYLSFAEYKTNGKVIAKPSRVKEVLEDNLLGELIEDNSYYGKEAPQLILTDAEGNPTDKVSEGCDAYYVPANETDADYIARIDGVYTDTSWYAPLAEGWKVEDGRLVLENVLFELNGENKFVIRSAGYKDVTVTIPYEKSLEEVALVLSGEAQTGSDVTVLFEGSEGDYGKYLTGVVLNDGIKEKTVYTKSQTGESGNDWYELDETKTALTLKGGLFKRAGKYTLTLQAEYYEDLQLEFEVAQAAEDENAKAAPKAIAITDRGNSYLVEFETLTDENGKEYDASAYLEGLKDYGVVVGEKEYTKALLSVGTDSFQADVKDPAYGGRRNCLKISKSGFDTENATVVTIRVEGYAVQSFTVNPDGSLEGAEKPEPETPDEPEGQSKEAPQVVPETYVSSYPAYIQFSSYDAEFVQWLQAMTETAEVKVNGEQKEFSQNAWYGTSGTWYKGSSSVVFAADMFAEGENTVEFTVQGYEPLTWSVTRTKEVYSGTTKISVTVAEKEEPIVLTDAPQVTPELQYLSYPGYLQFSSSNAEFAQWFAAAGEDTIVTVNGKEFSSSQNAWYGSANTWYKGSSSIVIATSGMNDGVNTIELTVDGYKPLIWYVTRTTSLYGGVEMKVSLTAPAAEPNAVEDFESEDLSGVGEAVSEDAFEEDFLSEGELPEETDEELSGFLSDAE